MCAFESPNTIVYVSTIEIINFICTYLKVDLILALNCTVVCRGISPSCLQYCMLYCQNENEMGIQKKSFSVGGRYPVLQKRTNPFLGKITREMRN